VKPIFVDTWAWVALADPRDPWHALAVQTHAQVHGQRLYLTSDYVINETITLLFRNCAFESARQFITVLLAACEAGRYRLLRTDPDVFDQAWTLRQTYDDKPEISMVDFISMAWMLREGTTEVFTGDEHFLQVNLGFTLVPPK
jgi:uncharacterized protein